jgi:hypothetical protein
MEELSQRLRGRFKGIHLVVQFLALGKRTTSNCLSVGRRQKTAAVNAVFGVIPGASLPPLFNALAAAPGRQI